jgi:flagellar hook-basal body complex protein FliE
MATNAFAVGAYKATQSLAGFGEPAKIGGASKPSTSLPDFGAMVETGINNVVETGRKAEMQAVQAASGKADLVSVATAVAEAETAMGVLSSVQQRVVQTYQEIMNMPV